MHLINLVTFVDFLSTFPLIKRSNKIKGKNDLENDAEHSYQLAVSVWYLADVLQLPVNRQLILEYALAHDLVEIHAGDTDTFLENSDQHTNAKQKSEEAAMHKIRDDFPEFISLHETIERYERLADPESKLVYIVDKILPDINISLSGDSYYKDNNVTHENWHAWLSSKIEKAGIVDEKLLALIDELSVFQKSHEVFSE